MLSKFNEYYESKEVQAMATGVVKFFNVKSRFGFISEDSTGIDYYFYVGKSNVNFSKDDKVVFETRKAKRGPEAINVKKMGGDS